MSARELVVCCDPSCVLRGADVLLSDLTQHLAQYADGTVQVRASGCRSDCREGPKVALLPGGQRWTRVERSDVPAIVARVLGTEAAPPRMGADVRRSAGRAGTPWRGWGRWR